MSKTNKIIDLLKFINVDLWVAENEMFKDYPIPFCFKIENMDRIISFFDEHDIETSLNFEFIPSSFTNNNIVIMAMDEINHKKFIDLFL